MKIVLASASPRRHELLLQAGIAHVVRPTDCDESETAYRMGEPEAYVMELARRKGEAYRLQEHEAGEIVLSADTVVYLPHTQEILGKPHDRDEAVGMLHRLSGAEHFVTTGVTLRTVQRRYSFAVTTAVRFRALADEEIAYYVDRFRPFDKAGGYGIQEWIGYVAIESINGSFYNVMGLPVQRLYVELDRFLSQQAG